MEIEDQIKQLMNQSEGNLAQITAEMVQLIITAQNTDEELSLETELEVLLQANYVLGFGGTVNEIQLLSSLLVRILQTEYRDLTSTRLHRFGCTVTSAIISHLSSSQHLAEDEVDLVPWTDDDADPGKVLIGLLILLIKLLDTEEVDDWTLELLGFMITLQLLITDLGNDFALPKDDTIKMRNILQKAQTSQLYTTWEQNKLEKSDYYRFVTLMMTQTSRDEEVWIDALNAYTD